MCRARMIVPPFLVSNLCPFDIFFQKKSRTTRNPVTVWDIFMELYRNVYQVKTMCITVDFRFFVSELWSFDCVLCLFCVIYILVHPITHSLLMISPCNFCRNMYFRF